MPRMPSPNSRKPKALHQLRQAAGLLKGETIVPKVEVTCEGCGKVTYRYPSQISKHSFCSRVCARRFNGARMHFYNQTDNPMNQKREVPETTVKSASPRTASGHIRPQNTSAGWSQEKREAVRRREQMNKGPCKPSTYPKYHGRHEHRVVAERCWADRSGLERWSITSTGTSTTTGLKTLWCSAASRNTLHITPLTRRKAAFS